MQLRSMRPPAVAVQCRPRLQKCTVEESLRDSCTLPAVCAVDIYQWRLVASRAATAAVAGACRSAKLPEEHRLTWIVYLVSLLNT